MLLIAHYVEESPFHGLEVFAAEQARKGAKIREFNPATDVVIPLSALSVLPEHVAERIRKHAEFCPKRGVFILGADGDSFMNHSSDPNLFSDGVEGFAPRDIEVGDEITCDYREVNVVFPGSDLSN